MNVKNSVIGYVTYKQLNSYGHIRRNNTQKNLGMVLGRRGRGRPRNTWMQEIMTGMKTKGQEEEDWNDRDSGEKK